MNDDIALIVTEHAPLFELSPEMGQYCMTANNGSTVQVWQRAPTPQSGAPVLVKQWPRHEVLCLLTEPEARLLWGGGCLRNRFGAEANVRLLVLRNKSIVSAHANQFFQTARDGASVQRWQMLPGKGFQRRGEWYPVPSEAVALDGQ
jgi:hypothetical protein